MHAQPKILGGGGIEGVAISVNGITPFIWRIEVDKEWCLQFFQISFCSWGIKISLRIRVYVQTFDVTLHKDLLE